MSLVKNKLDKKRQTLMFGFGAGIVAGIILLFVFLAGVFVGRREGGFLFLGRMHGFPGGIVVSSRFGHGAIGTIDSLGNDTIVIKERSGEIETILIDNKTILRKDSATIKFSDLKKGDEIIVIGEPEQNDEAVKAKFLRVVNEL